MSNIPLQVVLDTEKQKETSPTQSTKAPSAWQSKLLMFQSELKLQSEMKSLLEFLTDEWEARKDLQRQIQIIYTLIPKPDLSTTDRRSGVSPADKPILLESESNDY